ncbi:MAG: hypothetical protein M3161_05480 [Actinomycetota bacterium]|nr:hypothetical protein [Actinomycetota bacterium]
MGHEDTPIGIDFRAHDGQRSSRRASQNIWSSAVADVDGALAARIRNAPDWRNDYITHVRSVVVAGTTAPKNALRIAGDGLAALRTSVVFRSNGDEISVADALARPTETLRTTEVTGRGTRVTELAIPYRGISLHGDELRYQLDAWQEKGVMEPSAADALRAVMDNPDWLDLSDRHFALLGAASEMGPLEALSAWGANVIAIDLPRPHLWEHILDVVARGAGRLFAPVRTQGSESDLARLAGADLLVDVAAIGAWLRSFDVGFTVGNYVYADGATFVKLSGAVDALIEDLLSNKPGTQLAYLATPTDVFAVAHDIVENARLDPRRKTAARRAVTTASAGRLFRANYEDLVTDENGRTWGISDCLVPIQGANYALAKTAQRWRASVAREDGVVTSANVAPASHTRSVTKNKMLAAAYRGAPRYGIEIFDSETSRWLMAALLVHDLRAPHAAAQPDVALDHPYDLFVNDAVHGGIWRLPWEPRSVLPLALAAGTLARS